METTKVIAIIYCAKSKTSGLRIGQIIQGTQEFIEEKKMNPHYISDEKYLEVISEYCDGFIPHGKKPRIDIEVFLNFVSVLSKIEVKVPYLRNGQFFVDFHTWIRKVYNSDPFSISDTEYCFMLKQYFYTYILKNGV